MYLYSCTVPSAPTDSIVVIPHYSFSTREFVGLTVQFNQLVRYNLAVYALMLFGIHTISNFP